MKLYLSFFLALGCVIPSAGTAQEGIQTMPVEEVREGMKGYALTVFRGMEPERVDLEVLGILENLHGAKGSVILVRLHGDKAEYNGVAAGMSGSPVYIDGKLIGALAMKLGKFTKEAIGGVTPIAEMMETLDVNRRVTTIKNPAFSIAGTDQLTPIESPLILNGMTETALREFMPQMTALGFKYGAGSISNRSMPEPIVPGSMVGMILMRGDISMGSGCTVTYVDSENLLACGHTFLQHGHFEIPMTKAKVLLTLSSSMDSTKVISTGQDIGSFVEDRESAILGRFNMNAKMIPIDITLHHGPWRKPYHVEVVNDPAIPTAFIPMAIYSMLDENNNTDPTNGYLVNGRIHIAGQPDVNWHQLYAVGLTSPGGSAKTATSVSKYVYECLERIYKNPRQTPEVTGISLNIDLLPDHQTARILSAKTATVEVTAGQRITVEVTIQPFRSEPVTKTIPVQIPDTAHPGQLRIMVTGGAELDAKRQEEKSKAKEGKKPEEIKAIAIKEADEAASQNLNDLIADLNKLHDNDRIYVSLLAQNPQVSPTLPLSIQNVMRATQPKAGATCIPPETSIGEFSMPLNYEVTGEQSISLTVK